MRRFLSCACGVAAALGIAAGPAAALTAHYVPSVVTPNLQAAVATAAAGAAGDHVIYIGESPLFVTATITIGAAFDCTKTLTIRPDPGVPTLRRATIACTNPNVQIVSLVGCRCVTLQDLDIVRDITNAADILVLDHAAEVVVERCRIGSVWTVPGAAGFANVRITYPTEVVIRNCILFAYAPGTFDRGIVAGLFNDPANALLLYNNVVADYKLFGIDVTGSPAVGPLILLRNNVLVNGPTLAAEPTAFRSDVNANMLVVTSHNTAFATPGFAEALIGVQRISSIGSGTFLGMGKIDAAPSFVDITWELAPPWDPNPDFYRLVNGGLLHNDPGDLGVTVTAAGPHARDKAVADDIENDPRPGAVPPHTDRGSDQIEAGTSTDVGERAAAYGVLWAAPRRNPATGGPALVVRAALGGDLVLEAFDVAGRRTHRARRAVPAGWTGVLEWTETRGSGQVFYRLQLVPETGRPVEVRGRMTAVR